MFDVGKGGPTVGGMSNNLSSVPKFQNFGRGLHLHHDHTLNFY